MHKIQAAGPKILLNLFLEVRRKRQNRPCVGSVTSRIIVS